MRTLRDLPRATLERLYTFEDLHLRRTSVLKAIKRAIDRMPRPLAREKPEA